MSDIQQFGTYFTFDDIVSNAYGVWISGTGTYDAPVRDVESVSIPGKSGDLLMDNGRFDNIKITYPCFISRQFDTRFDLFKAAMLSKRGYFMLTDTYHPGEFRMASYTGGISPKTGPYNKSGEFDIAFDCMPQRFLVSGNIPVTFSADGTITNPTLYAARPLITVYGSGTVGVGGVAVTVKENDFDYIDIDCAVMDAHFGANNANSYITISGEFPVLKAGETSISMTDNIEKVIITPRWWTV